MAQTPAFASMGNFVVRMATEITPSSGIEATRTNSPTRSRHPQTISTVPTRGAIRCGAGRLSFSKRPTPNCAGKRNFWIPSETKTQPTSTRINTTARATRAAHHGLGPSPLAIPVAPDGALSLRPDHQARRAGHAQPPRLGEARFLQPVRILRLAVAGAGLRRDQHVE